MAQLLSEVAYDQAWPLPGARFVHPVDETQKHASTLAWGATHHPSGAGVLRLNSRDSCNKGRSPERLFFEVRHLTANVAATILLPCTGSSGLGYDRNCDHRQFSRQDRGCAGGTDTRWLGLCP